MHADTHANLAGAARGTVGPIGAVLGVAFCILVVLGVFWQTTWSMIVIWRTTTFEHCFLVIPISLWLVWQERDRLAATPPRTSWPALALIVLLGLVWIAAELGGVSALAHLAVIALIPASVVFVFGTAWLRILLFPLAFLFFAVPLGDSLIPWLIDRTADFTVAALRLTGIAVYREGAHFVIPSGRWSVVEACSGVRFLIASLMVGSLYAWLMYRSATRRIIFLLVAIAAPIGANWIRAYVTVLIAHLTSNQWMAGNEHVTFGRILFGAVLLLMFWIGLRWREWDSQSTAVTPWVIPMGYSSRLPGVFAALLAVLACWPVAARALLAYGDARPVQIVPMAAEGGWKAVATPLTSWAPDLEFPAATSTQTFERDGKRVGVFVGVYRNQDARSKLANSYNRLVREGEPEWRLLRSGFATTDAPLLNGRVESGVVEARGSRLLVWHWYWLGERVTTSATRAKIELALARLVRRTDTSAWVAVFVPLDPTPEAAEATLAAFLRDNSRALNAALTQTAER